MARQRRPDFSSRAGGLAVLARRVGSVADFEEDAMKTIDAVQRYIVDVDPANGGPIAYGAQQVIDHAGEFLAAGEWADGRAIGRAEETILRAAAQGSATVRVRAAAPARVRPD